MHPRLLQPHRAAWDLQYTVLSQSYRHGNVDLVQHIGLSAVPYTIAVRLAAMPTGTLPILKRIRLHGNLLVLGGGELLTLWGEIPDV